MMGATCVWFHGGGCGARRWPGVLAGGATRHGWVGDKVGLVSKLVELVAQWDERQELRWTPDRKALRHSKLKLRMWETALAGDSSFCPLCLFLHLSPSHVAFRLFLHPGSYRALLFSLSSSDNTQPYRAPALPPGAAPSAVPGHDEAVPQREGRLVEQTQNPLA